VENNIGSVNGYLAWLAFVCLLYVVEVHGKQEEEPLSVRVWRAGQELKMKRKKTCNVERNRRSRVERRRKEMY
jgi:hypothetical protein